MTMPKFDPVAKVNESKVTWIDWLDLSDDVGCGASLFSGEQLQQAYHAGKRAAVPENWKIVPKELTAKMAEASGDDWQWPKSAHKVASDRWAAMLAAAPEPPK